MFQRVRMSSGISSSQSILRFQSSCISNFGSRMAGEFISKGSNMLLVKLIIPRFVFGTSLHNTFTFRTSSFGSQRIPKTLSSGILSKSRSTSFGDKILFGSDFKILWLFDKNFVRLKPREFEICLSLLDENEVCLSGVFLKRLTFSTLPQ